MFLSALNVIIYALIVIIAIILVVLILIQPSKGGGLGSAFGGAGENVFGAHAMDHASKLTVWLIAIFFVLTLALTVISAHSSPDSLMTGVETEDQPAVPAATEDQPAAPAATEEQPAAPAVTEEQPAAPAATEEQPAAPAATEEQPAAPAAGDGK